LAIVIVTLSSGRGVKHGSLESDLNDDREENGGFGSPAENEEFRFQSVGEQLRAAREAQSLSLSDVATRTRVPMRHLEAIERADFAALPGTTYSIGFAKSYAKSLGLDENKLAAELREELAAGGHQSSTARTPAYEPTDPARVPPRWLAWSAAALAVVLLGAYLMWRSMALSPDSAPPPVAEAPIEKAKSAGGTAKAAPAIDPNGAVVITATDTVWLKIYDADKKRLYENEMKKGDSFTVPADANNPMILTGLPQVLSITVGGKPVPPLGTGERSISDVGISAAALLARKPEVPATSATPPADNAGAAPTR
jgi:cytoskeleton protein RodZ